MDPPSHGTQLSYGTQKLRVRISTLFSEGRNDGFWATTVGERDLGSEREWKETNEKTSKKSV